MSDIVYLADIGGDIDDLVAIDYLHNQNSLKCVVSDGFSTEPAREDYLKQKGIEIRAEIPEGTKVIFCGGGFTKILEYLKRNRLDLLVLNGFFAGTNIVPSEHQLDKFKGKISAPSYNPNLDWKASLHLLECADGWIDKILVVSKNVCHHPDNVKGGWHKDINVGADVPVNKKLHDLLMCREGLSFLKKLPMKCTYLPVNIYCQKESDGVNWRSVFNPYSNISISISYNEL